MKWMTIKLALNSMNEEKGMHVGQNNNIVDFIHGSTTGNRLDNLQCLTITQCFNDILYYNGLSFIYFSTTQTIIQKQSYKP